MPRVSKPRGAAPAGTNRSDTLATTADDQTLRGLAGSDTLASTHNRTRLYGDDGKDRLTTTLYLNDVAALSARHYGGRDNDVLKATVELFNALGPATSALLFDGGDGNDRIDVQSFAGGFDAYGPGSEVSSEYSTLTTTTIDGGNGNDRINAFVRTNSIGSNNSATNIISGGSGNDRIKAEASGGYYGMEGYATNEVNGGSGNDSIDALASVNNNAGTLARNVIAGGTGNDTIKAVAAASANSSGHSAENTVDGGDGDDGIDVNTSGGDGTATLRATIDGGAGDDEILSLTTGGSYGIVSAKVQIDGGDGDDAIDSTVEMERPGQYGPDRIRHDLAGSDGNDTLVAAITGPSPIEDAQYGIIAVNRLDGGAGNDTLEASIEHIGRSLLDGGSGADILKVDGGARNQLSGGGGADRLFAGSGIDRLTGSSGADDFVFDITSDQGADRILDFTDDRDRLCFIGLTDNGAIGLADDIDAISSIVDAGVGLDVTLTFDSGSVIVFEDCGIGTDLMGGALITSIADLVENPATQLRVEFI